MFTAHARCHVTCKQWVKNDHIFGIPVSVAILPVLLLWGYDDD